MRSISASKMITAFWSNKLLLFVSTAALACLSLSRDWRFTVFLGMVFFACYARTVSNAHGVSPAQSKSEQLACTCVSAFLLVVLSLNFSYTFAFGSAFDLLVGFGISESLVYPLALLMTLFGCAVGFPAIFLYAHDIISLFQPAACMVKKMRRQYVILALIYLCALLAIIRANFNFVDDLGRNVQGYSLTGSFSRYAASFFATFLHAGGWLTDISPLPQIVAALIMALAAITTVYVVSDSTQFRLMDIICLVPFGLSPYFLECLSYKYDAPYMALSVLAAVFPLLLRQHGPRKYILFTAFSTVLVCTTYQVSAGIFPLCVAFLCFLRWNQGEKVKEILPFLFQSVVGYAVGLLFFRFVMMTPIAEGDYVSASIGLRQFPANIYRFAARIVDDFNPIWLIAICLIVLGFFAAAIETTKRKKVPAVFMSIFALFVMFALSYGLYSFFLTPLFAPRAMYGFGILLSLLSWYAVSHSKVLLPRVAVCLLAWFMFAFSFTYGNALHSQQEYANFRIEQVMTDLSRLEVVKDKNQKVFAVSGSIGYAESVENMIHAYPVIDNLVPILLRDTVEYWGAFQLQHYYGIDHLIRDEEEIVKKQTDLTLLVDSCYHTISANEEYIFIQLK